MGSGVIFRGQSDRDSAQRCPRKMTPDPIFPSRAAGGIRRSTCAPRSPTAATSRPCRACASTSSPATSSRRTCRSGSRCRSARRPGRSTARLRTRNAAPFAAFLDFPDVTVLSASPERFLQRRRARPGRDPPDQGHAAARRRPRARRRPGAGAQRERQGPRREPDDRRPDAQRPVARLRRPAASASRNCSRSSATPPCITSSRPSPASWRRARDALDLLRATFPGGSITGAPKLRAMEIIAELEPSAARRLLRLDRLRQRHRRARHEHRHPDGDRAATDASTSAPAAASSPTPTRSRSTARRSTRPVASSTCSRPCAR